MGEMKAKTKRRRVSIWSVPEDLALPFYGLFYILTSVGSSVFILEFAVRIMKHGWEAWAIRGLVTGIPAMAISSLVVTLIAIDGGAMLVEIYRARIAREREAKIEKEVKRIFHDLTQADVTIPEKLREKYEKYIGKGSQAGEAGTTSEE